jgi:hypothetical protein
MHDELIQFNRPAGTTGAKSCRRKRRPSTRSPLRNKPRSSRRYHQTVARLYNSRSGPGCARPSLSPLSGTISTGRASGSRLREPSPRPRRNHQDHRRHSYHRPAAPRPRGTEGTEAHQLPAPEWQGLHQSSNRRALDRRPGDPQDDVDLRSQARRRGYRRPYQTRPTYASMMVSAGEPLAWVSNQMGHASVVTTARIYAGWIPTTNSQAGMLASKNSMHDSVNLKAAYLFVIFKERQISFATGFGIFFFNPCLSLLSKAIISACASLSATGSSVTSIYNSSLALAASLTAATIMHPYPSIRLPGLLN